MDAPDADTESHTELDAGHDADEHAHAVDVAGADEHAWIAGIGLRVEARRTS